MSNEASSIREYVGVADTAKMIRKALKANFPETKFTVRSHSYAGGASVRIGWINGPATERVDRVAQRYSGADFDGMTDSKSYKNTMLCDESGKVRVVHFGADFVFCNREKSPALEAAIIAKLRSRYADNEQGLPEYEWQTRAHRALVGLDIPNGEPVEVTAERATESYFNAEWMRA